ncbi:MAG: nucleotidyltransferase substrate binding protein [Gammaproteobacteria bacterium]|nr:nucleotidyltransferase substrate binding protein [Gammaproteobacteria bacterium]
MNDLSSEVRWKQRFQNFQRAFLLLREAMENDLATINALEREGIIQRFEYTFELAWKVLKDKMENDGIILDQLSPKMVIKQAYAAKYINDVEIWLAMIGDRNLMSHTYDFAKFEVVIQSIAKHYLPLLNTWYLSLLIEITTP